MAAKQHLYDQVSSELATWLDNTAGHLTSAMYDGNRAPFAAPINKRQQMEYYTKAFFNPDGTPNVPGRNAEMERLGVQGYTTAMQQVLSARGQGAIGAPPATAPMVDPMAPQGG